MDYFEDLTAEQIDAFIAANKWKFAKTMARIPHEYIIKEHCTDPEFFERFVMHIRRFGYPERFFKRTFVYFDVGGMKYWTMGDTLENTIVINRTAIENRYESRHRHNPKAQ